MTPAQASVPTIALGVLFGCNREDPTQPLPVSPFTPMAEASAAGVAASCYARVSVRQQGAAGCLALAEAEGDWARIPSTSFVRRPVAELEHAQCFVQCDAEHDQTIWNFQIQAPGFRGVLRCEASTLSMTLTVADLSSAGVRVTSVKDLTRPVAFSLPAPGEASAETMVVGENACP